MSNPLAILVEDDSEQAVFSSSVLISAGFSVTIFDSVEPTIAYIESTEDIIDLFVLDRRLPMRIGETPSDELGDGLFSRVQSLHPDSRVIVFTGFGTLRHVQDTLQGSGLLPTSGESRIDRVTVFEKDQSLEFSDAVEKFRALLQRMDDIEVLTMPTNLSLSQRDLRTLRRVALEYGASSMTATSLVGGLKNSGVWKCDLRRHEGHFTTVVVKCVKKQLGSPGLQGLLPRANAAMTVATLHGHMGGRFVNVMQLAGTNPIGLMDVVDSDPKLAAEYAQQVLLALGEVSEVSALRVVSEICDPLIGWNDLTQMLESNGLSAPAGSLEATVKIGLRHGDLHPSNIMIDREDAVLIDFDSSDYGAASLDPVTLLISTLVHPDSPLRGASWPTSETILETYGDINFGIGHSHEEWFVKISTVAFERRASEREFWAISLAYAARQLRFQDVADDPEIKDRVLSIATKSVSALANT
jgi:serine/threonine protein kinase